MASTPLQRLWKAAETVDAGSLQAEREALAGRGAEAFADGHTARAKLKAFREGPTGVSTIEKDAEVAAFLRERFKTRMTLGQLRDACVQRFGAERTPSEGRIGVFRNRVRM